MKKINIIINGSYGRQNAGDDCILYSIIEQLKNINNNINITVLSVKPEETKNTFGVNSIHTFNIFKLNKLLKKCDVFISGGGTLIQNSISSNKSLLYYLFTIMLAKKNNCNVIMYGCGFGPITNKLLRNFSLYVLSKYVDDIVLRDTLSYDELKNSKINFKKIKIGIDPTLILKDYINIDVDILNKLNINNTTKLVGICIKNSNKKFINEITKAIEYLYQKNYIPVLIPMCYKEDINILKRIASKLNIPYYLISENISFIEKYSLISKMNLVLGMKLHSVIFAYMTNTKLICISYDKKVDAFCKDFGISNYINRNDFTFDNFINIYNIIKIKKFNENKIRKNNLNNEEILKKYL